MKYNLIISFVIIFTLVIPSIMHFTIEFVPKISALSSDKNILSNMNSYGDCTEKIGLHYRIINGTGKDICTNYGKITILTEDVKVNSTLIIDVPYIYFPPALNTNIDSIFTYMNYESVGFNIIRQYVDHQTFKFNLREDTKIIELEFFIWYVDDSENYDLTKSVLDILPIDNLFCKLDLVLTTSPNGAKNICAWPTTSDVLLTRGWSTSVMYGVEKIIPNWRVP